MVHFLDLIGTDMGKKVIPEQVEYFCDICAAELKKSEHDDFTLTTDEALHDFSGSKVNNHCDYYELCASCVKSFKAWLKEMQK